MARHFSKWAGLALALAFAGCSSASQSLVPMHSAASLAAPQGWPAGTNVKPTLYVADQQGNVIRLYNPNTANAVAEGMITAGIASPEGLAVDKTGALYVSNVGAHPNIAIYGPGRTSPHFVIPGPGYYGLAVNPKGDIFATRLGTVTEYKPRSKKPYKTIHGFDNPVGIAVDSKNNVWIADDTANVVSMIPAGTSKAQNQLLKGLDGPVGLAFGRNDTLYVGNHTKINVYLEGSKSPAYNIKKGITNAALNCVTKNDALFQSNEYGHVVGYKKGARKPFSTLVDNSNPLGCASFPLVRK